MVEDREANRALTNSVYLCGMVVSHLVSSPVVMATNGCVHVIPESERIWKTKGNCKIMFLYMSI